jgi:RHS repeat-associated protein
VTDLTDSTGVTAKSYAYDAYGNIVDQTGTVDQPYTYTGREFDAETGLYYYRARYYDPTIGRFLQKDPIGYPGDIKFYRYVRNNPIRFRDPYGLFDMTGLGGVVNFWGEFFGAGTDFISNYADMRQSNWKGADKYFHCKANCEAVKRGPAGEELACILSDLREWWGQYVKGDPKSDSEADQVANRYGRTEGATTPRVPCSKICDPFRPPGFPAQY